MGALSGRAVTDGVSPRGGWLLEQRTASAHALHEPWPPAETQGRRIVCRCNVSGPPALVLGSTQREETADALVLSAGAMSVVQRRSGGGAVVVSDGGQLWIDFWIPRSDPLWHDDVVRGALWVGETWAAALASLGLSATVHRGRATVTGWSSLVCFAGMGPGEVSSAGCKVVGLSQRRTRAGARLQCMVLAHWDPASVVDVLALDDDRRRRARHDTVRAAMGLDLLLPELPDGHTRIEALASALLASLPRS